ncbi:hypothetical protein N7468_000113 [Penicillium chermesinum]|uniref:Uncharacterized protein n=1 Tax=Penicillium chermesinum TaxID=63820 RepID=A0A9W9TY53_9EURO|nr:uncharacterized protein N7468_000113 [Penicillium chermesinum]KAJ5248662.1 hypothetical protein N7468_000113 [Penicillium chermesinum]
MERGGARSARRHTSPTNRKTQAPCSGEMCAGLRHPSFPRRPERLWRAFPGAPCPSGAHKVRQPWGRDATFAIGAAWAHWAVMHRLSSGHLRALHISLSSHPRRR